MKNKSIKKLLVVFFLLNIILLGAYGYLFYAAQTKNEETSALYAASHEQASDKEKIHELGRMLENTKKDREKFSGFIIKTNAITFIEQIEKIGKNAGTELSVSSVSDEVKESAAVQLNFSATGSFSHLYHLIALIESMPYKVTIKKADIQKTGDYKEDTTAWRGNFTVTLESFISANATTALKSLP